MCAAGDRHAAGVSRAPGHPRSDPVEHLPLRYLCARFSAFAGHRWRASTIGAISRPGAGNARRAGRLRALGRARRTPTVPGPASEIDAYWRVLDRTLAWTTAERDRLRYSFFYDELVPRRTTMLQIADRIAAVNERGLARAEDQLAASSEQSAALAHDHFRHHPGRAASFWRL